MACYSYNLGERARCQEFGICTWSADSAVISDVDFLTAGNTSTWSPLPTPTGQPDEGSDTYIGFICCAISVVFFGINWTPAKKYESGDGVFFQFILCNAALVVGIIVHVVRGFPPIYPLAMVSGLLWCTGNVFCVTIIKFIGMGLGLLIWNSSNLLMGWASGKWGWFGINPQTPTDIPMNYGGVFLALLSAVLFVAVKPNVEPRDILVEPSVVGLDFRTMPQPSTDSDISYRPINDEEEPSSFLNLTPLRKRILGVCFSLFSGCLFGLVFTPIIYIQDHPEIYPNASKSVLDHVFTFTLGIYCTSLTYFLIYCMVKRNRPWVSAEVILPSFVCGLMWAVGQTSFLVAVQYLSEPVSFPIIASAPGIIAALVGVVFFKEIAGLRNYLILSIAFLCVVGGAVLSGLSKS